MMISASRWRRRSSGDPADAILRLSDLTVRRDGDWRASSTTIQPRNAHVFHKLQSRTGTCELDSSLPRPSHLRARVVGTEWNQRKMPGPLDRGGHHALALGTDAGLAAGLYLPPVGHVPAKTIYILVVNVFDLVNAEAANLSAAIVARPASAESARPSTGSAASRTVAATTGSASASRTKAAATGSASAAWTLAALLRAAGSASAAWTIASTRLRAATGPRPLRLLRSCLLCRHINSPSATWHGVLSVFAGPEVQRSNMLRLPG